MCRRKKITPGFGKNLGEVDLFGHESVPTLVQKMDRREEELLLIEETKIRIEKYIDMGIEQVCGMLKESKLELKTCICDILSVLTNRIKEIRNAKVSRTITLDKLLGMSGEPWQKSKYAIAISSIKTRIYEINVLIDEILTVIKKLELVICECNGDVSTFSCKMW